MVEFLLARYREKGGTKGFIGIFIALAVLIFPPLILTELMNIEPFTPLRLLPPIVWTVYLIIGICRHDHPGGLTGKDLLNIIFWPFVRNIRR